MIKVSIIIPVKNDKRIFDLISRLEKQSFKDFEVLIQDASDEKLNIKTNLNLRHFYIKNMSISDAFHLLAKKAKSKLIVITESDCLPSERWLEELLSEYENDKTIVVGAQAQPKILGYGNILIPKKAFKVPHDRSLKIADDTDWYLTLEERGFRFKYIDKALVMHYKNPIKRVLRVFKYGREHAYIYTKHNMKKKILLSILYRSALVLSSILMIILLIVYGIYYKIKFIIKGVSLGNSRKKNL
jgi:glycosyltransferase involved in cell wall biosynthesis